MKFSIDAGALGSAAKKGVHRKSHSPITLHAHVEANAAGQVCLSTQHQDRQMKVTLEASTVELSGSVCVPVQDLAAILLGRGQEVTLTLDDEHIEIEQGRGQFRLPVLPPEQFPLDEWDHPDLIPINPIELKQAILSVIVATHRERGQDHVKESFNFVHIQKGYSVAFSGNMLAVFGINYEGEPFDIHYRDAEVIAKLLQEDSCVMSGRRSDGIVNRLIVKNPNEQLSLSFRRIPYPQWNILTDKQNRDNFIKFDCTEFLGAINRCFVAGNLAQENPYASVSVQPCGQTIKICSTIRPGTSGNVGTDEIDSIEFELSPEIQKISIAFNVKLLTSIVAQFKDATMTWYPVYNDPPEQNMFLSPDEKVQFIVSPVRI